MPYITEDKRIKFKEVLNLVRYTAQTDNEGELNYLITKICHIYLEENTERYKIHNTIMGALESAKQEYYRKKVVPYEIKKEKENGII